MSNLSEDTKKQLLEGISEFRTTMEGYVAKNVSIRDFKGYSGTYGSYGERGAQSAMFRLRLPGGRLRNQHLAFLADAIRRHNLTHIHFTTGQNLQFHQLDAATIESLFIACHEQGIYSKGSGGNHLHNVSASPLRGIDPREYFDISPYSEAASDYILSLVSHFKVPRKVKIAFSNGITNENHVNAKDLGFKAMPDQTFNVYAGGGIGANASFGLPIGYHVKPSDCLYYIKAFLTFYAEKGNYQNYNQGRSRYLLAELGADEFQNQFDGYLAQAYKEDELTLPNPPSEISCFNLSNTTAHPRVHPQKSTCDGAALYYVPFHPIGGTIDQTLFLSLLDYLQALPKAEIRLGADATLYTINLTAEEALHVAQLTDNRGAQTAFESSISCVGSSLCQIGFQDSNGLLTSIIKTLHENNISTQRLPRLHISGCPSSCGTHQLGTIGFQGAVKLVDKKPVPAFAMYVGGSSIFGQEVFGDQMALLAASDIPHFFIDLAALLERDKANDFKAWLPTHAAEFKALVNAYN